MSGAGVRRAPRSTGVHARLATLPIGIGGGVRPDIRSRAWCAPLRGRRPVAGAALRRRGAQLVGDPRTLPVAAGANTPYHSAMLSASADLLATVATPMPRRATGHRRARWDGRANVRAPTTGLAAPVPGREADSAADGRSGAGQSRHLGQGPPRRQPRPRHHGPRFRSPPGVVSGWAAVGIRIRHVERAAVEHCGGRWHRRGTGTAVSGRVLRADRLVTGRALSHRQHTPGHEWCWRCVERVARGRRAAKAILSEPFREHDARISPDGQWLAYVSEETGRPVVSVRAMSGPPRRLVVSSDGGSQPVWRRDGREILYVDLEGRLRGRSVQRQPGGELTLGVANALSVPLIGSGHWGTQYDVSPDGQYVYFIDRTPAPRPSDIDVVIGWRALLK